MPDVPQRPILTPDTIPVQPPAVPYVQVVKVPEIAPKPPRWPVYFFIFAVLLAVLAAVPFVFPGVGAMLRGYLKNQQPEQVQTRQTAQTPQTNLPPELTQQTARGIALKAIIEAAGPEQIRVRAETLAIVDARTITTEYGWIFFWNSKAFVETNDIRRSIPGTGPIVVTKKGAVEFLATNKSPIEAINEYEVRIGVRAAPEIPTTTATTSTSTATTSPVTAGVRATTTATSTQ